MIDLFSRKVIAWSISGRNDVDLTLSMFQHAYKSRKCPEHLMFHSDRRCQYTAYAFRKLMDKSVFVSSLLTIVHVFSLIATKWNTLFFTIVALGSPGNLQSFSFIFLNRLTA
ncbi:MAG: DDE-type integrase/transposase/recombinase [Eubacteriales bacterium]